ncbi:hypothetical protein ACFL2Q_17795 [Thermodesulfobacteriota bacterium]
MMNLVRFVEACESGTDRSTFYNSSTQQTESLDTIHKAIMDYDRELYCLTEALGGFNDYNRLLVVRNLLFRTGYVVGKDGRRRYMRYGESPDLAIRYGENHGEQDWVDLENSVIVNVVWKSTPITRLLREWALWRKKRLNNARSKRLVLEYLLGNARLSEWALRYRPNLKRVLSHAWGDAQTRRIRKAAMTFFETAQAETNDKDLKRFVFKYVGSGNKIRGQACETICFIFGDLTDSFGNARYAQYMQALSDPEKLVGLPYDIAIGLRNRVHKDFPKKRLLESRETQRQMSRKQQVRMQRAGDREGVRVEMRLESMQLVDILKYGYEMGFNGEVKKAIDDRLEKDAGSCPFRLGHVAVVIDNSMSMFGREDRKLHPIAVAVSIGLLIQKIARKCDLFHTGRATSRFPVPNGDTDLASAVLEAYKTDPEMVLLITDGYENVTAGTLSYLLEGLRSMGARASLVQLSPVLAAEVGKAGGIRKVADSIYATAVKGAESIGTMYEKFLIMSADEGDKLPALKKYLLDKLSIGEIPASIKLELDEVETLTVEPSTWLGSSTD